MGEAVPQPGIRRLRAVDDPSGGDDSDVDDSPPSDLAPGQLPSFADGYHAWRVEMVRLAFLLTGSIDMAHDVVQDAFVRVHGRWAALHDPHAYVRRCVVNGCRSHQRSAVRQRSALARLASGPDETFVLDADDLGDALAALSYRERSALVLRFYVGLPDADIATALGCRPGTVASLIHRGLAHLRKAISP